jgi:hypothetical protein
MLYAFQSAFDVADVILTLRALVLRLVQFARHPPRAHLTAARIPLAHTFPSASSGRYLLAVQSQIAPWVSRADLEQIKTDPSASGVRTPTKTRRRKRLGGSPLRFYFLEFVAFLGLVAEVRGAGRRNSLLLSISSSLVCACSE